MCFQYIFISEALPVLTAGGTQATPEFSSAGQQACKLESGDISDLAVFRADLLRMEPSLPITHDILCLLYPQNGL